MVVAAGYLVLVYLFYGESSEVHVALAAEVWSLVVNLDRFWKG